jgi:ATP-dependent Clp protease adaptor protein ClpS
VSKYRHKKPRKWKVTIVNDEVTPVDFVIQVLMIHFGKSSIDAMALTKEINEKGKAVAGIYPYEIAETKLSLISLLSHRYSLPLIAIIEPDE